MPIPPMPVVVDRQDPRFDTLKKGHNLRFPATDAEAASRVVLCNDAREASAALQRVVSSGLRPTIRSGGHCYEDFVSNNPNGAILDLSLHRAVDVEISGHVRIAPGACLGDVYQSLYKRAGLTIPAGTCYMVGAGGHISGGGYGLLSRLHGLTVDWISAIDILTIDQSGKVIDRTVSATRDPDLFRACRGAGGGNFGIITSFRFNKLPLAPREVATVYLAFPWADMTEAKFAKFLITYGDFFATRGQDPDTFGLFTVLGLSPRNRDKNRDGGRISISAQFCTPDGTTADLSVLHEFFARFKEFSPTLILPTKFDSANSSSTVNQTDPAAEKAKHPYDVTTRPWLDATLADGGSGGGSRAKYKSAYMKQTFTPGECSAIWKFLNSTDIDAHGSILAIDSYGGTVNTPARGHDTAIAQRSSIMKLQWMCYWRELDQDAGRLKFMDDFFTSVYTGSHVPPEFQGTPMGPRFEGCYMNYADADMLRYRFWPQLFFGTGDLYPFLQKVKQQYDPNNIFHSSMSIRAT